MRDQRHGNAGHQEEQAALQEGQVRDRDQEVPPERRAKLQGVPDPWRPCQKPGCFSQRQLGVSPGRANLAHRPLSNC